MATKFKTTKWYNPTKVAVVLDLCVSANASRGQRSERLKLTIPPVGTRIRPNPDAPEDHEVDGEGRLLYTRIPSEFDNGIHQMRDGVIVGGVAPQLRRIGESDVQVAPALDPAETAKQEALRAAEKAILERKAAEEATILAAGNIAKAEKEQQTARETEKTVERVEQARNEAGKEAQQNASPKGEKSEGKKGQGQQ